MPVKDQAAYMREYRARKKAGKAETFVADCADEIGRLLAENGTLTEEVVRLKRELAARPTREDVTFNGPGGSFGYSRPAPKPGKK